MTSPPTILIIGGTGNTGRAVVETLPEILKQSKTLSKHRILCVTRSVNNEIAKSFAKLPGVEMKEQNWVEIDAAWLKENNVERIFIASHNLPLQFAEETQLYVNCLRAGVKYVVRISTTSHCVRSDSIAYYQRAHWAIEAVLSSPPYEKLGWTSLQPNGFSTMLLWSAADFARTYRKTGKQPGALSMLASKDTPIGLVDPSEVGKAAAYLVGSDDFSAYNHKKLVINGPEAINGEQIVKVVEQCIGTKVENVKFLDMSIIKQHEDSTKEGKHLVRYLVDAMIEQTEAGYSDVPTSQEILDLCPPKRTASQVLKEMIELPL